MSQEENRPPECQDCQKPCTIHLTQIINNQIVKMDMCADCPHAKKLQDPEQFGLMEKILGKSGGSAGSGETPGALKCPQCGFTEADFKRLNRFGCGQCYETFPSLLKRLARQLHRGTEHQGKIPSHLDRHVMRRQIEALRRDMQEAITKEDFERAAECRDAITRLEQDTAG
jgi:protein arginine kinase activator